MNDSDVDLLQVDRGLITAPAGCGKTQLICRALSMHIGERPILVLTHTNAGVAALRSRLADAGAKPKAFRLSTIDGWALRIIATFPARSGHDPRILELKNKQSDYPAIREAALQLLRSGHVSDVINASYDRVVVDEYQDCSVRQHSIVSNIGESLRVCILGDPMQAIFDFGADKLADWDRDVCSAFPLVTQLDTPWRWINAGAEPLGRWLLSVRESLRRGESVDLSAAPSGVMWVPLDGTSEDDVQRIAAANAAPDDPRDRVLIIAESTDPANQRRMARMTPDAITVEAVDLSDFVEFARTWTVSHEDALRKLVRFATEVMNGLDVEALRSRIRAITRESVPAETELERALVAFMNTASHSHAAVILEEMEGHPGVRCHRPTVLRACIRALHGADDASSGNSFYEAAVREREYNRGLGRPIPARGVGSTLLLKGLESEVAVLINPRDMNARNLYVAMTRGSKKLIVCSQSPVIVPRKR